MSFNKFIEEQIQKGIEDGAFDNLKGAGKPLDLSDYFNTPEELRLGYSVLKSGNILPPEIEMLKELAHLKEQLANCRDDEKKAQIRKAIMNKELAFNMTMERYKRKR
ncbi:MAG: DUF1992 domain-containing protein [Pyrinomonadaceae bacterium]|nr:DUF1992 domain-containing protein [Pyrinomonadaceae bacterium]